MLSLGYSKEALAFEFPFALAKGIKTTQDNLVVALSMGRITGLGEATSIGYYNADVSEMIVLLEKNRAIIERYALLSPERFWHFLHHLLPGNDFLISALDIAGWDLWSRLRNKPLYAALGLQWKNIPPTDYTIGWSHPDEIVQRVQQKPLPIYKLKVGGPNDLGSLEALRAATTARIRVDANEGWSLSTAKQMLPHLERLQVELIEQPLDRSDWDGLRQLQELTSIPIIADEACRSEKDLMQCLQAYDGINIKLSKCGGITPAIRMIQQVKKAGKQLMLGGMCEGTVGATALAHLLPLADYADIDGPLLLQKQTRYNGLIYDDQGRISLPARPGLGITGNVN